MSRVAAWYVDLLPVVGSQTEEMLTLVAISTLNGLAGGTEGEP